MTSTAAVVGGGPAGLIAAEVLARAGIQVDLFEAMPSVGRKFLMAGKGGLNLTHAEPLDSFLTRYGERRSALDRMVRSFSPQDIRDWAADLGTATFVGTSSRVFPTDFKAAPLLRAWLRRLRENGVRVHVRYRWRGWDGDRLIFDTPGGRAPFSADAVVLALGGASWANLGSDAAWVPFLEERGVPVERFRPANCGFDVGWSDHFRERFAAAPVKPVGLTFDGHSLHGEFVVTETGVEGSAIYALSAPLRDVIERDGRAVLTLDLAPGKDVERLTAELTRPRGSRSLSNHLRRTAGIEGVKAGLLREALSPDVFADAARLAQAIKALPLTLVAPRPIDEAISTAGGVPFEALDDHLMVRQQPGVFCAGEMLDWEAPTGGYLLTACLATGRAAGQGVLDWLRSKE